MSNRETKGKAGRKSHSFRNNWFIVQYAFKTAPLYVFLLLFNQLLHSLILFLEYNYMPMYVLNCIQYNKPFATAIIYILLVFALSATLQVLNAYLTYSVEPRGKLALTQRLQTEIYDAASRMDLACYDNPEFYNDFVWAAGESDTRSITALKTIGDILWAVTQFILSGVFMLTLNWEGVFFIAVSFAGSMFFNLKRNNKTFALNMALKPLQRKRDYVSRVFYLSDYVKELRLNPFLGGRLQKMFGEANEQISSEIGNRTKHLIAYGFLSDFWFRTFIIDGLYILYILRKILVYAAMSYGSAVALVNAAFRITNGLSTLSRTVPQFQENSLYIEKIRNFLMYRSTLAEHTATPAEQKPLPADLAPLEFRNVTYTYPGLTVPVLKDISFTVEPGKSVAIVGPNGAGKTTLTKLLMRLYDADEGEILYDGVNIKRYNMQAYRDLFGAVFQDYELFASSLADNVAMGAERPQKETVIKALEKAGFGAKLKSLRNGLDTVITREFSDDGTLLSGGEAQKVAIARVFYKNCPIFVLDEPSSALDPINEYDINQTILQEAGNKSVIFISHRLSTTRMADMIYLIEGGRIKERGNHGDLMSLNGTYAYMFNLQAEKYRTAKNP